MAAIALGDRVVLFRAWYVWLVYPGLMMNTPLAIPLSAADNIVQLTLAVPALIIVVPHLLRSSHLKAVPADQAGA